MQSNERSSDEIDSAGWIWLVVVGDIPGCSDDATSPADDMGTGYTVTGQVTQSGIPVAGAYVRIDNDTSMASTTDHNGNFAIGNVTGGDHQLSVSSSSSGGESGDQYFTTRTYSIDVSGNLYLDFLQLPVPSVLFVPTVESGIVSLKWTASRSADFREYKVYRADNPGIDETTGQLINVATGRADTTFTELDPLPSGSHYYRVFIMNEFGMLGGSNVESATISRTRLIITVHYTVQGQVDADHRIGIGLFDLPAWPDFQDEGSLVENDYSYVIDFGNPYYGHLLGSMIDENTYGPYYLASYFDITGTHHNGSAILPPGSPWVICDGLDPEQPDLSTFITPIIAYRGQDTEYMLIFGDEYTVP